MGKWKKLTALLAMAFMVMQGPVFAADPNGDHPSNDHVYKWNDKLGRGLLNFVTSPLEIPRNITNMSEEKGPAIGWTVGLAQGVAKTFLRAGVGVIETVTCPWDFPGEDKRPIIEPVYAWQGWHHEDKAGTPVNIDNSGNAAKT